MLYSTVKPSRAKGPVVMQDAGGGQLLTHYGEDGEPLGGRLALRLQAVTRHGKKLTLA